MCLFFTSFIFLLQLHNWLRDDLQQGVPGEGRGGVGRDQQGQGPRVDQLHGPGA